MLFESNVIQLQIDWTCFRNSVAYFLFPGRFSRFYVWIAGFHDIRFDSIFIRFLCSFSVPSVLEFWHIALVHSVLWYVVHEKLGFGCNCDWIFFFL